MEELACPRCRTTKYRNPSLKLLVNICGHSLCDHCVELLFARGTGQCPECGIALKRSSFKLQLFEDADVEKEVDIRKKILKDFNKKEDDFESLREYNDYLEEIETIVFNLAYGVDVDETKRKVDVYKKDNKDQIRKNQSKLSKDEQYLEELLEDEKHHEEVMKQILAEEEGQKRKTKVKGQQALIDDLMFSDMPADQILAIHKRELAKQEAEEEKAETLRKERITQFSSGISLGKKKTNVFLPIPTRADTPCFEYEDFYLEMCGPQPPDVATITQDGYINHVRAATESERGGGFERYMACQRALHDALSGLYCEYIPKTDLSALSTIESDLPTTSMEIDQNWD